MKMEVLSVQNQFPVQFGIGSTKGKGWTSPLTPPSHHYSSNNTNIDIVDGRRTKMSSPTAMQQNLNHHHHLQATTKSRTNRETTNYSDIFSIGNIRNGRNINSSISETINNTTNPTSGSQNNNRYNSNLVCMTDDDASVNSLSIRLQDELREAKSRHLACTEVSLPFDLTPRIAAEIIKVSEKEPCGIRGCTIYIEFEDEPSNTRRIASMRVDPNTVPTFELYLTLKQDNSGWTSMLPQFIKNLRRSSTILISRDFSLTKNKLYHSSSE